MQFLQQNFSVNYSYNVVFTSGLFTPQNTLLSDFLESSAIEGTFQKIFFIVDQGVASAHAGICEQISTYFLHHTQVKLAGRPLLVPGGEQAKNGNDALDRVLQAINENSIDRHSYLAVIGGGAVLDMAGYAAAIAHRGVRLIRIPTTVLSQNDSGVGVKNGINQFGKKNFLGTFSTPVAVFNDAEFLKTLDARNWRSGMSEAVKVALIKDADFFDWIEASAGLLAGRDAGAMNRLVYRCAALHMQHIAGDDPFETGSSRPLDYGHWSAHKIEQLTSFELLHGEAVAIGIALDTIFAFLAGYLAAEKMNRILNLLNKLGFELNHPVLLTPEKIFPGLEEFREHLGGRLTIMMLTDIGTGKNVHSMDEELFMRSVQMLMEFSLTAI